MIVPSDPRYRHVSVMLQEVYERYRRPIFVAETGIEDETRPAWLRYICKEVFDGDRGRRAGRRALPLSDRQSSGMGRRPPLLQRACSTTPMRRATRACIEPLAEELSRQQANVAALEVRGVDGRPTSNDLDTTALDWAAHVMQERTDESRTTHDKV